MNDMSPASVESYLYRSVVLKITDHCNLGCDYCYRGSNRRYVEKKMDIEVIRSVTRNYIDCVKTLPDDNRYLYFIWHGGEPLLAGIEYFNKIMSVQKELNRYHINIINSIQTNGTILNKEWVRFLKKNDFLVGISLDGPVCAQDIHRRYKNGKSSFNATVNCIKLLKENDIEPSAISVITDYNRKYGKEMFDFFRDIHLCSVDFIPCFDYGEGLTLTGDCYAKFMIDMLDRWFKSGSSGPEIRFFSDLLSSVSNGGAGSGSIVCELAGRCGMNFSVMTDGDIYPCECLNPKPSYKIGNILTDTLAEIIESDKYKRFISRARDLSKICSACEYLRYCKGGCFNRRLPEYVSGQDYYCSARKQLIAHILHKLGRQA